jgi:hypothetical protein
VVWFEVIHGSFSAGLSKIRKTFNNKTAFRPRFELGPPEYKLKDLQLERASSAVSNHIKYIGVIKTSKPTSSSNSQE